MEAIFFLVVFLIPLALLGAMARDLAKKCQESLRGRWFFVVSASLLTLSVVWGYRGRSLDMAQGMRTAAAMEYSAMFVRSILIVAVCGLVKRRLAKRDKDDKPARPAGPPFLD
jgi:hypothetical protein